MQRRLLEALVRMVDNMALRVKRGRGMPERMLEDIIKSNLMVNSIPQNFVFDQVHGLV